MQKESNIKVRKMQERRHARRIRFDPTPRVFATTTEDRRNRDRINEHEDGSTVQGLSQNPATVPTEGTSLSYRPPGNH